MADAVVTCRKLLLLSRAFCVSLCLLLLLSSSQCNDLKVEPESVNIQTPFHSNQQSAHPESDDSQREVQTDQSQSLSKDEDTPTSQTTPTSSSDQSAAEAHASLNLNMDDVNHVVSEVHGGEMEGEFEKSELDTRNGDSDMPESAGEQQAVLNESAPEENVNHASSLEQPNGTEKKEEEQILSDVSKENSVARDTPGNHESNEKTGELGEASVEAKVAADEESGNEEDQGERVGRDSVLQSEDSQVEVEEKDREIGVGQEVGVTEAEGEVPNRYDDDMMTFEEFKQKKMEEALHSSQRLLEELPVVVGGANAKSKNNYASVDCGAKVIKHNLEAKNAQDILKENKDAYMINPCSADIWFIVELCELVSVRSLEIASFELFSSTPKSFKVYASERYDETSPVDWLHLGTFHAEDERRVQQFPLDTHVYAKYIKVEMLSHYGDEHYCPLSLLRVLGASMMDIYEESQQQKELPPLPTAASLVLTEGGGKDDVEGDQDESELLKVNKTLLRRAREVVLSMLEHPMKFVHDIINKDEGNSTDGESHDVNSKSHDHSPDTPPSASLPVNCEGDECVDEVKGDKTTVDTQLEPPVSSEQKKPALESTGEASTAEQDKPLSQVAKEGGASDTVEAELDSQSQTRLVAIMGDPPPPGDDLKQPSTPQDEALDRSESEHDNPLAKDQQEKSDGLIADSAVDTNGGVGGVSLGPTSKEGVAVVGEDGGSWNTGGAISSKDSAPVGSNEGEGERDQSKDGVGREEGLADTAGVGSHTDVKSHDQSGHTHLPLLGPDVILTITDNEEKDTNQQGNPLDNEIPDKTSDAESEANSKSKAGENGVGNVDDSTDKGPLGKEGVSITIPADVSMATNDGGEPDAASKLELVEEVNGGQEIDKEEEGNGGQTVAAGLKGEGSCRQVDSDLATHGATNDSTIDSRLDDVGGTAWPAVSVEEPANELTAHSGNGAETSEDIAISQDTDFSSSGPAVASKGVPSENMQRSEDEREREMAETAVNGDGASSNGGEGESGGEEGKRRLDSGEEVVEDIQEGTNSVNASSTVAMPPDQVANQNRDATAQPPPAPVNSSDTHVDGDDVNGMNGMQANEVGSKGQQDDKATVLMTSSPDERVGGVGRLDDADKNVDGISGIHDIDGSLKDHTHSEEDKGSNGDTKLGIEPGTDAVNDRLQNTITSDSLSIDDDSPLDRNDADGNSLPPDPAGEPVNASLSNQRSPNDGQPQDNGSLVLQNPRLGDEMMEPSQSAQTKHDKINNGLREDLSPTHTTATLAQQQGAQGGTGAQNSAIPPLSTVNGGNGGNGIGGAGGPSFSSVGPIIIGRDREKSVFLRLSNQIQELEMNMSLFSSYLDQISSSLKRNKNRTEETCKAQDKKISFLNESMLTISQAIQELTSKEISLLQEVHRELKSQRDLLHSMSDQVNATPNQIHSSHVLLLLAEFVVMAIAFLVTCAWISHTNRLLERKLTTLQRTLSAHESGLCESKSPINGALSTRERSSPSLGEEDGECLRSTRGNCRTKVSTHTRSLSFPSVSDIQRQSETIGGLSRPDFTSLTSAEDNNRCVNGHRPGVGRGGATVASGCGQLSSHSLTSLDHRRSFEIFEGRRKKKNKSKTPTT